MREALIIVSLFLLVGTIAFGIVLFLRRQKKKAIEKIKAEYEQFVVTAHEEFSQERKALCENRYACNSDILALKNRWKTNYNKFKDLRLSLVPELEEKRLDFIQKYIEIDEYVKGKNACFIIVEKERCADLFSNIDGKKLDAQQQDVVVFDEDNTLVIAGAGSGKTLTIAGKVKYLCEVKGIQPNEILLISFTRKAAEEMTERISKKLGIPVTATTFHKLGLDIIKAKTNESQDVVENLSDFVSHYFETVVMKDQKLIKDLLEFFAYYLQIPANVEDFSSLGEAFEHQKGMDFETIKSKVGQDKYTERAEQELKKGKSTLQGERVKSLEEVTIANFLFLNGIEYEYEKKYPHQENDAAYKVYRPDFYLPQYDIYLEHFGINEHNRLPWLSPVEEQKYLEGIAWKRKLHLDNHTTLVETYSYYSKQGILLDKLKEILLEKGVIFKERDYIEIFDSIYGHSSNKYFEEFIKLCCTFITLYKSNGYATEDIDKLKNKIEVSNAFFFMRNKLFVSIVANIIKGYEEYLAENKMIDFSDMINTAAKYINEGFNYYPYKYIIIDEYQDVSVARYNLVKAIKDRTKAKVVAVGDDWQSIYRFAGSDIQLFSMFEKYFGFAKVLKIEKTYRNSQQLIDEMSLFISKNPNQIKKQLCSDKSLDRPITFFYYENNVVAILEQAIDKIIEKYGEEKSIMFLGRTSYDIELLRASRLFDEKKMEKGIITYSKSPRTPMSFLTVHKSKGLEADNIVLLNFNNSTLGFPNKISDDPVLGMVLSKSDSYPYAEERRLLYVAITRTRNSTSILVNENTPSEFIHDFERSFNIDVIRDGEKQEEEVFCPHCKTGRLLIRKAEETNKYFVGCSNYPQCDYTVNDISIMKDTKNCPRCGGFMVKRNGTYGKFYGCTNYPTCNYTEDIEGTRRMPPKKPMGFGRW